MNYGIHIFKLRYLYMDYGNLYMNYSTRILIAHKFTQNRSQFPHPLQLNLNGVPKFTCG